MKHMNVTVCTKCRGPVAIEGNQYICALCGTVYGDANNEIEEIRDYSDFFKNISLEELRKIGRKFSGSIVIHRFDYYNNRKDDQRGYVIAPLSNGQFYTRYIPGDGYDGVYRGQCAAENWFSVKSIYSDQEYSVAIGTNGELQPTLIEMQNMFKDMKRSGISDMRMKQIIEATYEHNYIGFDGSTNTIEASFFGVDINGKVVIYNPYEIFLWDKEDKDDQKKCLNLIKKLKTWSSIKKLYYPGSFLIGVTEEGNVFVEHVSAFKSPDARKQEDFEILSKWKNIDDIVSFMPLGYASDIYIGLKKDGTLISNKDDLTVRKYLGIELTKYKDVAQISSEVWYNKLAVLTRKGKLYVGRKEIDKNVIALVPNGYVSADGKVYERINNSFSPIEGLKLFESVETVHEEYEESEKCLANAKNELEERKNALMIELENKSKDLTAVEMKYDQLGFFKIKEKKALRPSIDAISYEINEIQSSIKEIETDLLSLPDGKAKWSRIVASQTEGLLTVGEIRAAAYNNVSYKNSGTSVVGSAIVGGIVAGPAGAIVGAIYAADKNNKTKQ